MQTLVRIKHLKQERMRYVRNLRFKISQMIRLIDSFTSVHYHITLKFEHYCKILAKFLSVANESLPSNANKCLVFHSFKFQVHEHPSFSCWWHNDTHLNQTWLRHLSMALHWITMAFLTRATCVLESGIVFLRDETARLLNNSHNNGRLPKKRPKTEQSFFVPKNMAIIMDSLI